MERFLIKREPYFPWTTEEIFGIDKHLLMDEKPNNIKLEYNDNNTIGSVPIYSENNFEIKPELHFFYEENPTYKVENEKVDLEEVMNVENHALKDEILSNIKLENTGQDIDSIPICSENHSAIKQVVDSSHEDHLKHNFNNNGSDNSISKLRIATIILKRLSTFQILKYTKRSEADAESTRLNVDTMKYMCKSSCSVPDHQQGCQCKGSIAYECLRCNRQFISYPSIRKHINIRGLCNSNKRFLDLEELNYDEWKKLNCPKCNVSLLNINQFIKHVNGCENVPKFWCSLCKYGAIWIANFRSHLKLHARNLSKTDFSSEELMQNKCDGKTRQEAPLRTTVCYCPTCDKTVVVKGFRILSKKCSTCNTPYKYRCPTCDKEYAKLASVRQHTENTCNYFKNYRCLICKNKEFSSYNALNKHMSRCEKPESMQCKLCPLKTFKYKCSLQQHLIKHLEKDRNFYNRDQNEGTNCASRLYNQFCKQCNEPKENSVHRADYRYCLKCSAKLDLYCQKCNAMYKSHRSITAHVEFNCGLESKGNFQKCSKCDGQYRSLNTHMYYCRNQYNFCAHCSYKTTNKSDLIKHLSLKHQKSSFEIKRKTRGTSKLTKS